MPYRGLCIGGPMDGRRIDYATDHFRVAKPPNDPLLSLVPMTAEQIPEAVSVEEFTYTHFDLTAYSFHDAEPGSYTFWIDGRVPYSERSAHVMSALVTNYRGV